MKRRAFLTLLGGAAAAWPVAGHAQQPAKLPTIGFLGAGTASSWSQWTAAFVQRLRELGWVEGRTVAIEYRWADGRNERIAEIVGEFVRLKVDVIFSSGSLALIAKQLTSSIPIVFALSPDPVGAGLVASLARPGGNVTGLSNQQSDSAAKRIELLREVVPGIRRLGILAHVNNAGAVLEMREAQAIGRTLGLEVVTAPISRADDIAAAFDALKDRADALYVCSDFVIFTYRIRINTLALVARLPMIYGERENVEAGGLMAYGPSFPDLFRRAGDYVDKILRGAKPADLPVEQPTKFTLAVNLTTAKALGLAIPESFLLRADEVIE